MSKTKFLYWLCMGFIISFIFSGVLTSYDAEQTGIFNWTMFFVMGIWMPIGFLIALGCLAGIIFLVDVLPDIIDERDKKKKENTQQ